MSLPVETLRTSFRRIIELSPNVTHRFYEILFERRPMTRRMFARHAEQEKLLAGALAAVVAHLEDGAWLTSTLCALGARHAGYSITDEMYGWVGEALLATFAETLGGEWTAEIEQAWTAAYGAIAGLMQEGARQAGARAA